MINVNDLMQVLKHESLVKKVLKKEANIHVATITPYKYNEVDCIRVTLYNSRMTNNQFEELDKYFKTLEIYYTLDLDYTNKQETALCIGLPDYQKFMIYCKLKGGLYDE